MTVSSSETGRIMNASIQPRRHLFAGRFAASFAAALLVTGAWANDTAARQGAAGSTGQTAQCEQRSASTDPAACRQEAGAAQQARRQGDLTGAQQPLDQNALARCGALPAGEQAACRARIEGSGQATSSGSVSGGGILREHREVVEAPPGTPTSAGAATVGAGSTTGSGGGAR